MKTVIMLLLLIMSGALIADPIIMRAPAGPFYNGQYVGTVVASDEDAGQYLTYRIISGNTKNSFSVNSFSGDITISNANYLNRCKEQFMDLGMKATDNGTPKLSSQCIVTIILK